jgi:GxxExxY protein
VETADLNTLSNRVIGAGIEVHRALGPGLLERVYSDCLFIELDEQGLRLEREVAIPVSYKNRRLESVYRLDLLVEGELIVEVKALESLLPIHSAQLLTYLKLTGRRLGLLMNFNVEVFRHGIKRVVNGL